MNEMTLLEMQEKLNDYCAGRVKCFANYRHEQDCPLKKCDCVEVLAGTNYNLTLKAYNIVFGKEKTEMKKEFTKADLKNRMVVELRNGERRLFVGDGFIGFGGCNKEETYDNDLLHIRQSNWDIVKVLQPISFLKDLNNSFLETVWQRPEPKKMTKIEIEKELGYEIEIVE